MSSDASPKRSMSQRSEPARERFGDGAYLTVAEVAQKLEVSEKLVRTSIKRGELPAYNFGRRKTVVRRADLHEWQESRRIAPAEKTKEEAS